MNRTNIGWTDFTSNPIRYRDADGKMVWACERLSPACAHCYAADLAKRYGRGGGDFTAEEMATYTPYFDEAEARKILTAKTIGGKPVSGSKCFIGDMTDVFGEWVPDELLDKLFAVMALRSDVTFQVLTKRPERMRAYMQGRDWGNAANRILDGEFYLLGELVPPLPNVWLGTSVENQHWADKRIPELLQTPAAVRFLSIEPLLGAIDLVNYGQGTSWLTCHQQCNRDSESTCLTHEYSGGRECFRGIDWIIVGGESGGKRRDCGVEALVNVARQGVAAGVPVFVKQDVALHPGQQGRIPDEVWALKQVPASE